MHRKYSIIIRIKVKKQNIRKQAIQTNQHQAINGNGKSRKNKVTIIKLKKKISRLIKFGELKNKILKRRQTCWWNTFLFKTTNARKSAGKKPNIKANKK